MAADPLTNTAIDDIFNADFSDLDDDLFGDNPTTKDSRDDKAVLSPRTSLKRKADDDKENDGLGLDEEVKIVKQRKPIAKLDEARLLSEPGIPKLRSITRSRQLGKKLRLKGKGHEFTDAARLLNHFQLWLDNLYPRAKFADALQLAEKAGHTKRMQIIRNEWINEGKPGYKKYDDVQVDEQGEKEPNLFGDISGQSITTGTAVENSAATAPQSTSLFGNGLDDDALFIPDANRPSHIDRDQEPSDDELDALLAAQEEAPNTAGKVSRPAVPMDDSEGEDDLDALFAEQEMLQSRPERPNHPVKALKQAEVENHEHDEDDLDALLAEQETRDTDGPSNGRTEANLITRYQTNTAEEDEDEDDLEALLAMQRTTRKAKDSEQLPEASLPTPHHTSSPAAEISSTPQATVQNDLHDISEPILFSSSPMPPNPEEMDIDDLDALLASQEAKTNARVDDGTKEGESTPRAVEFTEIEDEDEDDFLGPAMPNEDSQ